MPLSLLMSSLCLGCYRFALSMLTRVQASEFDTDGDCLYALTQELLLLRTSFYNIGSVASCKEQHTDLSSLFILARSLSYPYSRRSDV